MARKADRGGTDERYRRPLSEGGYRPIRCQLLQPVCRDSGSRSSETPLVAQLTNNHRRLTRNSDFSSNRHMKPSKAVGFPQRSNRGGLELTNVQQLESHCKMSLVPIHRCLLVRSSGTTTRVWSATPTLFRDSSSWAPGQPWHRIGSRISLTCADRACQSTLAVPPH